MELYNEPTCNAAIGYLDGKLGCCQIVTYKDQIFRDSSISYFPSISWKDSKSWAKVLRTISNQSMSDAHQLIELRLDKCMFQIEEVIENDQFIETKRQEYLSGVKKLIKITDDNHSLQEINNLEIIIKSFPDIIPDWFFHLTTEVDEYIIEEQKNVHKKINSYINDFIYYSCQDTTLLDIEDVTSKIKDNIESFPIRAFILRIKDNEDGLKQVTHGGDKKVDWKERNGMVRKYGEGYVQSVLIEKEPVIIPDINEKIDKFKNKKWIKSNNFRAFASFPLMNGIDDVIGTFTLYFSQKYDIREDPKNYSLIECIAYLLSNIVIRHKMWQSLNKLLEIDKKQLETLDTIQDLLNIIESQQSQYSS